MDRRQKERLTTWLASALPGAVSLDICERTQKASNGARALALVANLAGDSDAEASSTHWIELVAHSTDGSEQRLRLSDHDDLSLLRAVAISGHMPLVRIERRSLRTETLEPSQWLLAAMPAPEVTSGGAQVLGFQGSGNRVAALAGVVVIVGISALLVPLLGPCVLALPPALLLSKRARIGLRPIVGRTEERVEVGVDADRAWIAQVVSGMARRETSLARDQLVAVLPDGTWIAKTHAFLPDVGVFVTQRERLARIAAIAELVRRTWGGTPPGDAAAS